MATVVDKKSNHIKNVCDKVTQLLNISTDLQGLFLEASIAGMNYGDATLGLQDSDFVGINGYLNAVQYRAIIATLGVLNQQLLTPTDGVTLFSLLMKARP